ncbi:MAG: hypothetical protein G01um101431_669 [Parcubacteria group bacterium Gr01-1014_31]|nr:MAG: hypothetical protein G01um101431_669 [Parcubacteria group bacterium Gr01-1014_31]
MAEKKDKLVIIDPARKLAGLGLQKGYSLSGAVNRLRLAPGETNFCPQLRTGQAVTLQ